MMAWQLGFALLLALVSCTDVSATWALNSSGVGEVSGSSFALAYTVAIGNGHRRLYFRYVESFLYEGRLGYGGRT